MQMPFCAIMRSWTLFAAFGGSYAPGSGDMASKEAKKTNMHNEHWLTSNASARSAHGGRTKLLRGYEAVQRHSEPTHDRAAN